MTWEEIPLASRCGFITKYTIFYRAGNTEQWQCMFNTWWFCKVWWNECGDFTSRSLSNVLAAVTVNADVRSHVLTDLTSETDYAVHIMASTVAGSKNGSDSYFRTMKYGMSFILILKNLLWFLLWTRTTLKLQKDVTRIVALICICFLTVGDGEVEMIVVVVCLSFLFLTVFIIMFCLRKREVWVGSFHYSKWNAKQDSPVSVHPWCGHAYTR